MQSKAALKQQLSDIAALEGQVFTKAHILDIQEAQFVVRRQSHIINWMVVIIIIQFLYICFD